MTPSPTSSMRLARLDAAARLILRDPELARDAVPEGLIRAWRDLPGLRDPNRFEAWLQRLTVNACLDLARRRRRRPMEVELTPIDSPAQSDHSADGARIFYQRWFPDSIQLWVMNADGTGAHEFYPEPGRGWDGIPTPSPDGRWVAYWHVAEDGSVRPALSVVRVDGTGPFVALGPQLTGNAGFSWSPDSTKILMMPDDGSSQSAYLLDPAGGPWTTVPWRSDVGIDWQRLAP